MLRLDHVLVLRASVDADIDGRKHIVEYPKSSFFGAFHWELVLNAIAVFLLLSGSIALAQTPQEHVHQMAPGVMPFDMAKTIHVFKMTESGGVQKVLVRDPRETDQVGLIRQHLKHEAEKFQRGDYSDPVKLHGADMPGLTELQANASRIVISYSKLPAGAQITFKTEDLGLLTAVHRWFGAQLSEHGADARAE